MSKDIGLKIGTKEQIYWTSVKELSEMEIKALESQIQSTKVSLEQLEKAHKLQSAIIDMSDYRIQIEIKSMKK